MSFIDDHSENRELMERIFDYVIDSFESDHHYDYYDGLSIYIEGLIGEGAWEVDIDELLDSMRLMFDE